MNIDDLLCVGATDNIMLSSTIGRNKSLINGDVISEIINGTEELLTKYKEFGVNIISTGGETAEVGDLVRTIIVDSTVVARMKRKDVINNANILNDDEFGISGVNGLPSGFCYDDIAITGNMSEYGYLDPQKVYIDIIA